MTPGLNLTTSAHAQLAYSLTFGLMATRFLASSTRHRLGIVTAELCPGYILAKGRLVANAGALYALTARWWDLDGSAVVPQTAASFESPPKTNSTA